MKAGSKTRIGWMMRVRERQGEEETVFCLNEMLVEKNRVGKKVEPRK